MAAHAHLKDQKPHDAKVPFLMRPLIGKGVLIGVNLGSSLPVEDSVAK